MNRISFLFCITLAVLLHAPTGYASEPHGGAGESVLIQHICSTWRAKGDATSLKKLQAFFEEYSKKRKNPPWFMRGYGSEFAAAYRKSSTAPDGILVATYLKSEKSAEFFRIDSQRECAAPLRVKLPVKYSWSLTRGTIRAIDLNADGSTDYLVRFIGEAGGGANTTSSDCLLVKKSKDKFHAQCFEQDNSLPDKDYIQTGRLGKTMYLSHLADLDGDGVYELIVTTIFVPTDIASSAFWPDIYAWNGSKYALADKKYPNYYKALKKVIEKKLQPYPKSRYNLGWRLLLKRAKKLAR